MKILLVEDNPVDHVFVTQSLRQAEGFEHELHHCATLAKALKHLTTEACDVVLLDLWLPDSEGLETCSRLIALGREVPVVVMTSSDDRTLAKAAIRCGAQDYLVKGVFPGSAIARVLQYAIDRFHFQQDLARQRDHFQQILSHVPAIIWTTDHELKITSTRGAGLQPVANGQELRTGHSLTEYFQESSDVGPVVKAHQRVLEGQSVSLECDWSGRTFEMRVDPLRELGTDIVGTIGIALDVTERRSLDREMNFARLVQESLLPAHHPSVSGFEIFGGSRPARQTCGDWFDYVMFPDASVGLMVGDVSGKGFGPAILSATMAAYLEVLAETHSDVQEILDVCNRMVCKRCLPGQFAVLSLARLQPDSRTLTYGGAGEGMLIVGGNGQLKQNVESSGIPVGLVDDTCYEGPVQIALQPGDILLLLTDGFREAISPEGELFGNARIVETAAAHASAPASEIFRALRRAAREFTAGLDQQDDMTGIVVKVLPASG